MNFAEAEAYLYSLGNEVETMKLGLKNISALLAGLGEPQTKYKKVQVAGTNGKGSVCAFLDSICRAADIRTGLYTSPHLISITERIKIDGVDISEDDFARLATHVREALEALLFDGRLDYRPTFFEQVTAIALLAFADAKVELAIVETGLGGRYDAVTAARAEIAAITRIDLDHQEYLGDTIEEIAAEKAAIIREDSIVVVGEQSDIVLRIVLERCEAVEARLQSEIYEPWTVVSEQPDLVWVETYRYKYSEIRLGLAGKHQIENARTAVKAAQALEMDLGFEIEDTHAIVDGLEQARHPGRLEYIGPFLLDGAHNPGGAAALADFLDQNYAERPVTLLFGTLGDKAITEIAEILWPRAEKVILTRPLNSRAMTADELAAFAPASMEAQRIIKTDNVNAAIEKAREITPSDGLILVTGSLYLVGEVRRTILGL